jgi:methylthioribose-1-phosphate isomerase
MRTVEWRDGAVVMIDQTLLPAQLTLLSLGRYREVAHAIRTMQVRGAPAIGVSAAFGVVLAAQEAAALPVGERAALVRAACRELAVTRLTASNLFWALERMEQRLAALEEDGTSVDADGLVAGLLDEAQTIADEDEAACRAMGRHGAGLISDGASVLTHCNAGGLATVTYGTALAPIRAAHEAGRRLHVLVDETRPLLQGARLTAWELAQEHIPHTLITDNMAAHFMSRGRVDLVLVGADRIAANGDTANKIGTYGLAVLAHAHAIPFYVVAPLSTIDLRMAGGASIPIEERAADEVTALRGVRIAPAGVAVANPAFDVTPARLITAIVTERGIVSPPYLHSLPRLFERAEA